MNKLLKKYLFCFWFHYKHRCYPEAWDRGLKGPWHCDKCHPCGEEIDEFFKKYEETFKE